MRICFLLFLLLPLGVFAQEDDTMVYEFPDVEAQFPGGAAALQKFILTNIVYPDSLTEMDFQSTFYFSFVVEKDGSLTQVKLERGMDSNYADYLLDFFNKMPWIPGKVGGETVRTRCRLPILLCPLH